MGNLLKFPLKLPNHDSDEYFQCLDRGHEILGQLPDEKITDVVTLIAHLLTGDIMAGVSGEGIGPFFKMIDKIYKGVRDSNCYFCNEDIDPNETEFTRDTHLCLFCLLKVSNILTAAGVDPEIISGIAGNRGVQKTRL